MVENHARISGSWFPTGYHGHFRDKARPEVVNFYRQRAKPAPPSRFLNRSKERSNQHLFSRHDNRHTHATSLGDLEMYFEMGLGKGKPRGSVQHWKDTSNLLRWSNEGCQSNHNNTTYQATFRSPSARYENRMSTNEVEPIHGRSGSNIYRRQVNHPLSVPKSRTAPLLAWNEPDNTCNAKPAVGNPEERRSISDRYHEKLQRKTISVDTYSSLLL